MPSTARLQFLAGVAAFSTACDDATVRAPDDVGGFLRRGMTVAAFNLLETFLDDRLGELAVHVNGGSSQFLDLPERLQKRAISQTLEVASARLRRNNFDIAELRDFSQGVGVNLTAMGTSIALSPYTWAWSGSNLGADDLSTMLSHFQIDKPWEAALDIAGRLGFPIVDASGLPLNLRSDFQALAAERHKAAHVASHPVTSLWLRAVPLRILRLATAMDIMASGGAHLLRLGDADMLAGVKWNPVTRVKIRYVRERAKDFAEFTEGRATATRRAADDIRLWSDAAGRCGALETLVRQGLGNEVTDWALPCVD